jgi:peptide deformylase
MITKNEEFLRVPCDEVSVEEGLKLGKRLKTIMRKSEGIGLAANQIGVRSRVCIINVTRPLIFVNPVITESEGSFQYEEGCLSFPGQLAITNRFTRVKVKCDNYNKELEFSVEKNALECVCVQHEIDHLNGILMFDR